MGFITDIEWEGKQTFDAIDVWFCLPMQEFLKMFDEQFGQNQFGPEDPRAVFFYYEMRSKVDDLTKLLCRLGDDYDKNPIPDKSESRSNELKERLVGKLAAMMGVNPEYVPPHEWKYSVDDLQLMVKFFKYLHKGESKHKESIKELLTLAAREVKESTDTAKQAA